LGHCIRDPVAGRWTDPDPVRQFGEHHGAFGNGVEDIERACDCLRPAALRLSIDWLIVSHPENIIRRAGLLRQAGRLRARMDNGAVPGTARLWNSNRAECAIGVWTKAKVRNCSG
jgi:hypothetical protein